MGIKVLGILSFWQFFGHVVCLINLKPAGALLIITTGHLAAPWPLNSVGERGCRLILRRIFANIFFALEKLKLKF